MHQNTSITKASALASSYGNARASPTVADANAPAGWAAEADRAASATAPATRAPSSPSRTTSYRTATSSSTARPREATAPAGDPDFDVYATGGLNAFVCTTTFLGFDQFSFWNSCMGSHADSQVVPDAKLAAGGSPLPGSPAIGSGKNPTSKCAGQPTPGPRRPGLQQRRHDPPRHRALEHRRELAPRLEVPAFAALTTTTSAHAQPPSTAARNALTPRNAASFAPASTAAASGTPNTRYRAGPMMSAR